MTDTAKPTPGPWDGAAFSDKDWVIYSTDENQKFDICHFFGDDRHVDEVEANAMLLLEAAEAFNETNLTPRQLLERVRELEAGQKALLSTLKTYVSSMQIIHEPGRSEAINAADDAAKNLIARFEDAALAKHGEEVS